MQKVIAATLVAGAALATTAAFADTAKTSTDVKPTAIERLWSGLTNTGVSAKNADKKTSLSSADRVRLSGFASTGKPNLDDWVRKQRSTRTDGPNG